MELAGIAIAAIAAVAAIASAIIANKQRKDAEQAARDSQAEATRAVEAAEKSADAAGRSASAAESSAVSADRSADAQEQLADLAVAEAGRTPWELRWRSGDTYSAANVSPSTLFNVSVIANSSGRRPVVQDVHSGASVVFMAPQSWGQEDSSVDVTWYAARDSSEQLKWRDELPPKPKE